VSVRDSDLLARGCSRYLGTGSRAAAGGDSGSIGGLGRRVGTTSSTPPSSTVWVGRQQFTSSAAAATGISEAGVASTDAQHGNGPNYRAGFAKQTVGSILASHETTRVHVALVSQPASGFGGDHGGLTVNYKERSSAANMIPRGYHRKDSGQTTRTTLIGRLVDRAIRPLMCTDAIEAFNTQLHIDELVTGGRRQTDVLAINAASEALIASSVPWANPVAAVRTVLVFERGFALECQHEGCCITCIGSHYVTAVEAQHKCDPTLECLCPFSDGCHRASRHNTEGCLGRIASNVYS
jgi:hypothetical protein